MTGIEKQINSELIYDGKILKLWRDNIELEDKSTSTREVVESAGGSCVLAIDSDDMIYLVKQFRYPYHDFLVEIPAGKLEKDENPEHTALRELKEECGLVAKKVTSLGVMYPTVAYCTEKIYIYYVENFEKVEQSLDEGEFIDIIKIPFEKAYQSVLAGDIHDAKTQVAILKYAEIKRNKNK